MSNKIGKNDDWHGKTCGKIISIALAFLGSEGGREDPRWSGKASWKRKRLQKRIYYGQVQKCLKMMIKYMWITGKWETEFQKVQCFLHIPVDNKIIENVWKKNEWEDVLEGILIKNDKTGKFGSDKVESWSRWDVDQYTRFQAALKEN